MKPRQNGSILPMEEKRSMTRKVSVRSAFAIGGMVLGALIDQGLLDGVLYRGIHAILTALGQ